MTPSLRQLLLLILVCCASLWGGPCASNDAPSFEALRAKTAAAKAALAAEVKAMLAEELGVPLGDLRDDTDLVTDLKLDQGVVYNAVSAVLDSYGAAEAGQELTRVGDIMAAVAKAKMVTTEAAPPPDSARKRFRLAPPPGEAGEDSYVQTVFYVTDRKPTGDTDPDTFFGSDRSEHGALNFGRAEVNIPTSHKPGLLETSWLDIQAFRDKSHHIFILKLDPTSEDQFFGDIIEKDEGDVVVYVHGFNVRFEDAILRAAQLAVDFGFKGAPIVYSWPSAGGLTSYNSDWENVNWSTAHIAEFLAELADKVKGRKIHLVAHSMGSKGLLNALNLLALRGKSDMFGTVILCAPDYDAGMFAEQIAAEIRPLASQWVIYTSRKDVALMASEEINTLRLGTPVTLAEGFEIIDASEVEVTPWSVPETHSYYATKKVVLDDMVAAIRGLLPDARGLKATITAAGVVWSLK